MNYSVHPAKCDGAKPAVLAIVSPYCDRYIPAALAEDLPLVLSDFTRKSTIAWDIAVYFKQHITLS